jgi:hypothetical protein
MSPDQTFAIWRSSLKSPDDSIFYYHPDLERILLGLSIFALSSRPLLRNLDKAEALGILNIYIPGLITAWIEEDEATFEQLLPMVMTVVEGYTQAAIDAEKKYPASKKAVRMMAYLLANASGAGGDMNNDLADELLDDLTTDGKKIYSDKIKAFGIHLLVLTKNHGIDIPLWHSLLGW